MSLTELSICLYGIQQDTDVASTKAKHCQVAACCNCMDGNVTVVFNIYQETAASVIHGEIQASSQKHMTA